MNIPSRVLVSAGLSCALLALATAAAPLAESTQLFDTERLTAVAVVSSSPLVRGTTVRAAVEIRVGRGFHVNSNPASEDFLIPTTVSATAAGVEVVEVFYPDALERTFGFWPEPLKVWDGNVVAGVVLRITDEAALGDTNLDFLVDYQACNDDACFAPAQVTARVPVIVAEVGTPAREVESPLLDKARFVDNS